MILANIRWLHYLCTLVDVEVEIELQKFSLEDVVLVALNLKVEVVLLIEQVGVFRESHSFRHIVGEVERAPYILSNHLFITIFGLVKLLIINT